MSRETEESTLDRAYDAWIAGEREQAARLSLVLLEHDPNSMPALVLASRALLAHATDSALEAARGALDRAGQAAVRRGNLPMVAIAAAVLDAAGGDEDLPESFRVEARVTAGSLRRLAAEVFGKGSARVAEVPPAPPSLPPPPEIEARERGIAGEALYDRLESVVLESACEPDP